MDWPTPKSHLLSHADKDIAKRTQWASLVYLAVFLLMIIFTPYFSDHYTETIFLGIFLTIVSVARTILVIRFDKMHHLNPQNWRLLFTITTYLLSGCWGIFCMLAVMQYNLEWTSMLVVLSTAGIAAVAVTTLSIYPHIIIVFLFLVLVPSIGAAAYLATNESIAVTIMFLVFAIYLYFVSKRLSREYWVALENASLLDKRARQLEDSNKELESYSYSIAHDLRGPLRTITAFSQILLEDADSRLNKNEKDYLDRIIHAGLFMAELIDDILELSRLTRLSVKPGDVNLSLIAEECVYSLQSTDPGRKVSVDIEKDLIAKGDAKLLRVVIQNLLGNAWKFTRDRENPEIKLGLLKRGLKQVFYVSDNGVGFDMKYAKKIFGIFQRLHTRDEFEGTGIGLASVERVINRHGGKIWVDSRSNEGATFYFTLPDSR
jgi:signal transduction histidine kinase